jgi:hypothetical protein
LAARERRGADGKDMAMWRKRVVLDTIGNMILTSVELMFVMLMAWRGMHGLREERREENVVVTAVQKWEGELWD